MVEPIKDGTPEQRSEYFRQMQKKSRETYTGSGGFRALKQTDPAKLKEITSLGGKARWQKQKDQE